MRTDCAHPLTGFFRAPVAGGEEDFTPGCFQRHRHGEVARLAVAGLREVAEVVLEEIHTPVRKRLRIDEFMVIAAGIARARPHARAGVHAELQSLAVNVVSNRLHAMRELLRVRHDAAIRAALAQAPAVVNDQIFIPRLAVALRSHQVSHFKNQLFVDLPAERVPRVPAHRGQLCKRHKFPPFLSCQAGDLVSAQTFRHKSGNPCMILPKIFSENFRRTHFERGISNPMSNEMD